MTISVVIPAYNEEKYIGDCLRSIFEHKPDNLTEVIVVSNASTDKTAQVAGGFSGVKVVNEPQKGITKARQRGFEESTGELVACLDSDTRMPDKWFGIVNAEFEKNSKLVCLSGPFIYYELPKIKRFFISLFYRSSKVGAAAGGSLIQGGNFVVRRSAIESIGGFDTTIAFYGEDINIARRLSEVGEVKFTNDLFIYSSARRLSQEGLAVSAFKYGINYLSENFLKKPAMKKYKDIR